jgi:hypothetical protein
MNHVWNRKQLIGKTLKQESIKIEIYLSSY